LTLTLDPSEINPDVMNPLGYSLGMSKEYEFVDLYSLTDTDLLNFMPRPALALLFIYPHTKAAQEWHTQDKLKADDYNGPVEGTEEPVVWFRQTVINGMCCCFTRGRRLPS
jgi:ubiquitin carboxyl-terminal hydrolase L3